MPFVETRTSISCVLAVALRQRVAEQVLAVELVGDSRERGAEILSEADLGVAAAGFLGHPGKPGIRQILGEHRLEPGGPEGGHPRLAAAAPHADGVDHHALAARALDHFHLADEALRGNWSVRCPCRRSARGRPDAAPRSCRRRRSPCRCRATAASANPAESCRAAPREAPRSSRVNVSLTVTSLPKRADSRDVLPTEPVRTAGPTPHAAAEDCRSCCPTRRASRPAGWAVACCRRA